MTTLTSPTTTPFPFPPTYSFPPFFSPQPNASTHLAQLTKWSSLIQSYCAHHHLFSLTLDSITLSSPLFHNSTLQRRLAPEEARKVVEFMISPEGKGRAEWKDKGDGKSGGVPQSEAWIWWREPEEWATRVERWVEETGQKGSVLTLWELVEGEATVGQDWVGMGVEGLKRILSICVKRGKAQVFGAAGEEGVKFF